MTNPKTSESRAVAGRAKPTNDSPEPTAPVSQDVVLEQLVALTRSIKDLVERSTEPSQPQADIGDPAQRARVVFAYEFLGSVLGRRAPRVFQLRKVGVTRGFRELTFTGLQGATAAKIRSNRNVVVELTELRDGAAVNIDPITSDERIDSIVVFNVPGGVPVAIGPWVDPLNGGE